MLGRRKILGAAGLAGLALPVGALASLPRRGGLPQEVLFDESAICRTSLGSGAASLAAPGPRRKLKLSFNANAICTVGVPVAKEKGIFERYNLDVDVTNFGGSTDQLLEAIATGKADAGVGMALRWLKPLEQGFDVRITAATHGGCMRLFALRGSGINTVADLKGKTLGVTDMAAPDKNFFGIVAAKLGIDPENDISYRVFPGDLLAEALKRGEVQAFALGDPMAWILRERDDLFEVSNNLSGEYANRSCCVIGVRNGLIREDRPAARALTAALLEAQDWIVEHPAESATIFAANSRLPREALVAMLNSHTHGHHPANHVLRQELVAYLDELKLVRVIRASTNTQRLADRIYTDVLSPTPT